MHHPSFMCSYTYLSPPLPLFPRSRVKRIVENCLRDRSQSRFRLLISHTQKNYRFWHFLLSEGTAKVAFSLRLMLTFAKKKKKKDPSQPHHISTPPPPPPPPPLAISHKFRSSGHLNAKQSQAVTSFSSSLPVLKLPRHNLIKKKSPCAPLSGPLPPPPSFFPL